MDDLTEREKHLIEWLRQHPAVMDKLSVLKADTRPDPRPVEAPDEVRKATPEESAMYLARSAFDTRREAYAAIRSVINHHQSVIIAMNMALSMLDDDGPKGEEIRKELENW